jgi:GDP-D-mannose dehydratase
MVNFDHLQVETRCFLSIFSGLYYFIHQKTQPDEIYTLAAQGRVKISLECPE